MFSPQWWRNHTFDSFIIVFKFADHDTSTFLWVTVIEKLKSIIFCSLNWFVSAWMSMRKKKSNDQYCFIQVKNMFNKNWHSEIWYSPINKSLLPESIADGIGQARTQGRCRGCIPHETYRGVDITSISLTIIAKSIFALHITRWKMLKINLCRHLVHNLSSFHLVNWPCLWNLI